MVNCRSTAFYAMSYDLSVKYITVKSEAGFLGLTFVVLGGAFVVCDMVVLWLLW